MLLSQGKTLLPSSSSTPSLRLSSGENAHYFRYWIPLTIYNGQGSPAGPEQHVPGPGQPRPRDPAGPGHGGGGLQTLRPRARPVPPHPHGEAAPALAAAAAPPHPGDQTPARASRHLHQQTSSSRPARKQILYFYFYPRTTSFKKPLHFVFKIGIALITYFFIDLFSWKMEKVLSCFTYEYNSVHPINIHCVE